jgi:hypothetical protein
MGALAVLVAQIVDPIRIIAVASLLFLCRLATNRGAGWLALIVGIVVLAWFFAFVMLGQQTGDPAWNSAAVGVISNAVIVAILLGLLSLYRRFF